MRRPGLALVLVAGVLGVLAVLSLAFVGMAQMERRSSIHRVASMRALLLARAGVEDATARLEAGQDPDRPGNVYRGEDWDGLDSLLSGFEKAQEVYRPSGASNAADVAACPVEHAMHPSFHVKTSVLNADPALVSVEGRFRGYSGRLSGGASPGPHYALRIHAGGFFINGGDPALAPTEGYNAMLRRMMGHLAEALDRADGLDDGLPVGQADGEALLDHRPPAGWRDLAQIRVEALGNSQAKLDALEPYLLLRERPDLSVIRPTAVATMAGAAYGSWRALKAARSAYPGSLRSAPGYERMPVADGGRVVGRAPVDLAWARRDRPALLALLGGLKGFHLNEKVSMSGRLGTLDPVEIVLDWTQPSDDARHVADLLMASGQALDSWPAWEAFCDAIPDALLTGTTDQRQAKRDVLKANFNPNANLNKFNPDPSCWKTVDKSDLVAYSTEFSCVRRQTVRISSCGRVTGPGGNLLAQRTVRAEIGGPLEACISTQREFVCEELGDPGRAGDETGVRLPGAPGFLGLSNGLEGTWGHALAAIGGRGLALQSYPEPCVDRGTGLEMVPADYDGSLRLATVETASDQLYGIDVPGVSDDMKMLARFTAGFDLDVHDGPDGLNITDSAQVAPAELTWSVMADTGMKFNTLYPDGAFSEPGAEPAWYDAGNAHGFHGVMSFWVKPAYRVIGLGGGLAGDERGRRYVSWTNRMAGGPMGHHSLNQFFAVGDSQPGTSGYTNKHKPAIMFEIGHYDVDTHYEHLFKIDTDPVQTARWHLWTCAWDFRGDRPTVQGQCGGIWLDDGLTYADRYSNYMSDNVQAAAMDITLPDSQGAHHIALGGRYGAADVLLGMIDAADATFDEFALYDFGGATSLLPAPDGTLEAPGALATNRYRIGRYCRGDTYAAVGTPLPGDAAGTWISAPLRLPPGSRLLAMHWAFRTPSELPDDYVEPELLDESGTYAAWTDSRASRGAGWMPGCASWHLGRTVDAPLRIRASFLRSVPLALDVPITDAPSLDEVRVLYAPPGGRRVTSWE